MLKLRVERSGSLKAAITVKVAGLPEDVSAPAVTVAPNLTAVDIPLKAQAGASSATVSPAR